MARSRGYSRNLVGAQGMRWRENRWRWLLCRRGGRRLRIGVSLLVLSTMDANPPAPAGGDWRAQLQPEARRRIISTILENLSRLSPVSEPEGLNKLRRIAVRFEEKIYNTATSQDDLDDHVDVTNLCLQRVQKMLAVLNKSTKGGCYCMSLLLSVVPIVILVVIVWILMKHL